VDNVISQLQSAGLIVDGMPDIGILRRCKVDGDTGRKESGWYILHELRLDNGDLVHVGRYGNWKTLGDESLAITFDKPLSSYDQDRIKKQTQLLREVAHLRELVEERLTSLEQRVDARFKAQDLRFLLYIGGALGVMRLDLPSPITAVAVGLMVGKGLLGVFTARFF